MTTEQRSDDRKKLTLDSDLSKVQDHSSY